ncbi:uncharacterized protein VTP21DRAFT_3050 [Calcarisporiella thermophila]|uniref:uncharacterized protein n=1 Tax=Calcarisporiella thermophila TaxID=911321 RepID=UPI0037446970
MHRITHRIAMSDGRSLTQIFGALWKERVAKSQRSSFATVTSTRFAPATDTRNATINYQLKYADKLKIKAEREGCKSVEELKQKTIAKQREIQKTAEEFARLSARAGSAEVARNPNGNVNLEAKKLQNATSQARKDQSLDQILKLDLIDKEDPDTISNIWIEYHKEKDGLTSVIPAETYETLYSRSKQYPMFLLPLPQDQGIEFYLLQFQYHQCSFTSLIEYKTHGENARPHLTLTHYTELMKSKGIVLMRGEINEPRILSSDSARYLVYALQQFYITGGEEKLNLLREFHERPQDFKHEKLIEAMDKLA